MIVSLFFKDKPTNLIKRILEKRVSCMTHLDSAWRIKGAVRRTIGDWSFHTRCWRNLEVLSHHFDSLWMSRLICLGAVNEYLTWGEWNYDDSTWSMIFNMRTMFGVASYCGCLRLSSDSWYWFLEFVDIFIVNMLLKIKFLSWFWG